MNAVLSKPLTASDVTALLRGFAPPKTSEPKVVSLRRDLPDSDEEMFQLERYPLFDLDEALKQCATKGLVIDLLSLMLRAEELPKDVQTMEKAFREKNYSLVEATAHKIKGGACYVGTVRMKYACQYLERYWKAGESQLFDSLFMQALAVIAKTCEFVQKWLQSNS